MGHLGIKIFWGGNMKRSKTKNDYIETILRLHGRCCHKPSDYADKSKLRTNNAAQRQLHKLEMELKLQPEMAAEVFGELLESEDIYMRGFAAYCSLMYYNVHEQEAVEILEELSHHEDPWISLSAQRNLKIWRKELDPTKPF